MEDFIPTLQEFFTIDRLLAIVGIGVTFGVAAYIYKIQKKAQRTIDKINRLFDAIARRRINWYDAHIGGLLRELKRNCEDLYQRVEAYQDDNSRDNLIAIVIGGSSIQRTVNQLHMLFERDIELAKDYISDPYMVGKFIDVIPTLGWDMDKSETEICTMRPLDLANFKSEIEGRISEIQGYIDRVDEEVKNVNS